MKTFAHQTRQCIYASLLFVVAACAPPVREATAPVEAHSYETVFENAVRVMNKMGHVLTANRDQGLITGMTPSGVTLEIEILRAGGTSQLQVQARIPESLQGTGAITEPDRYLDLYRNLSRR